MPQIGSCTDLTCDQETKALYECHCCLRLICLNHVIEHVEITKRNNERFHNLSNELLSAVGKLKLITEKKLFHIEREKNLIEQATKVLDTQTYSVDDIQTVFDQINHVVTLHRAEEAIVKVEPSLLNMRNCSCVCKCDNDKNNHNDQSLSKNIYTQAKSPVYSDYSYSINEVQKSLTATDDEYSMYINDGITNNISLDETTDSIKDECDDEEENRMQLTFLRTVVEQCPLTFNGAYGLTKAKHSIRLCSKARTRSIGLYSHLLNKHKFKEGCAARIVHAVATDQDPMTTKLFDGNEDVINHYYEVPCPFSNGTLDVPGYSVKSISHVPCRYQSVRASALLTHLKHYHNASRGLAQTLVDHFKETQARNYDN